MRRQLSRSTVQCERSSCRRRRRELVVDCDPATTRPAGLAAVRARVAGPLGLAWWTRPLAAQFTLSVAPDLLRDDAERAGAAGSGTRARSMLGAGGEVLQLREYRPGRSAARHRLEGDRAQQPPRQPRFLRRSASRDRARDRRGPRQRAACRRSRSLRSLREHRRTLRRARGRARRSGRAWWSSRIGRSASIAPGRGIGTVARIRAMLTAVQPAAAESNPLNAVLRIRTLVRHRSLVVMLTDLDDATVAGQLASAARLLLPKHLPLVAGLASPGGASTRRTQQGGGWLAPYEALAAQEYCARLARNAAALRALGAPTLLALPNQMERAVFEAYTEFRDAAAGVGRPNRRPRQRADHHDPEAEADDHAVQHREVRVRRDVAFDEPAHDQQQRAQHQQLAGLAGGVPKGFAPRRVRRDGSAIRRASCPPRRRDRSPRARPRRARART